MRFERVIVTGGSGLLGRFVVDELTDICAVSVLDIKAPNQDVPGRDVAYIETDILDLGGVRAALAGLEKEGIYKCHLFILPDNLDAKAFWCRLGWIERETELYSFHIGGRLNP